MRTLYAAALVALAITVGLLVAGCAGGTGDEAGLVLRSVTFELEAPSAADAAAVASRATTTTMFQRIGRASKTAWAPSAGASDGLGGLTLISHEVHVDGLSNQVVRVGNDAWGYYLTGDGSTPSGGDSGQATNYTGLVYYVFARNETSKTMKDPWLELTDVDPGWAPDADLSGAPKGDVGSTGPTMADWAGTDVGKQKGVPGPKEWDPTNASTYADYSGWDDLDSGLYERALYFKHGNSPSDWTEDVGYFAASLKLWWYEDPTE